MTLADKIFAAFAADWAVLTDPFFIGLVVSVIIGLLIGAGLRRLMEKFGW